MNINFVPATGDQALQLEKNVTQTANYAGASIDLSQGTGLFSPGGCGQPFGAVVRVSAIKTTAGNETYAFKIQESPDGVNWIDITVPVAAVGVGGFTIPAYLSKPFVRVGLAIAGTAPTITYSVELNPYVAATG